jgi:hypothetical protein
MAAVGDTIPSRDKSFDQFQPKISLTTTVVTILLYMPRTELVSDLEDLILLEVLQQLNFG